MPEGAEAVNAFGGVKLDLVADITSLAVKGQGVGGFSAPELEDELQVGGLVKTLGRRVFGGAWLGRRGFADFGIVGVGALRELVVLRNSR